MARGSGPPQGDLFGEAVEARLERTRPLAARMRPEGLEDIVGQPALLGPEGALRAAIAGDRVPSMILYGPPGSGKTTLARVVAASTSAVFEDLSAVSATVADVRAVMARARDRLAAGTRTVLFLDEIHRFNRAQQDALLPAVEDGLITLIGATTQNPWYEVNAALVSRMRVWVLEPLGPEEICTLLDRAVASPRGLAARVVLGDEARAAIAARAGGDARGALNLLEAAAAATADGREIALDAVQSAAGGRAVVYDRQGDAHYDTISAFIKSLRGSDPDAAIYWLAVMLKGGEDPQFIARRLIVGGQRGRRQRRPAGPRRWPSPPGGRSSSSGSPRPASAWPRRRPTSPSRPSRTRPTARSTPRWPRWSARAPADRPWPCATRASPTPAGSATERATSTPTTIRTRCSASRCFRRAWRAASSTLPPTGGRRASCRRACARCAPGCATTTTRSDGLLPGGERAVHGRM